MPKILSGLSDVTTSAGATAELKCYLLTVPGLETRWVQGSVYVAASTIGCEVEVQYYIK